MRSKGVACRSVAVVPTIGQKLEMHRVAEFFDGRWKAFDPSSLRPDVPAKPWHNIIMAKTTTEDERAAMTPRMGAMVGCPYGQELELLTKGVTLFGEDFFWTEARPLAEFEPGEEAGKLAADAWRDYLKTGTAAKNEAASATSAAELLERLRKK